MSSSTSAIDVTATRPHRPRPRALLRGRHIAPDRRARRLQRRAAHRRDRADRCCRRRTARRPMRAAAARRIGRRCSAAGSDAAAARVMRQPAARRRRAAASMRVRSRSRLRRGRALRSHARLARLPQPARSPPFARCDRVGRQPACRRAARRPTSTTPLHPFCSPESCRVPGVRQTCAAAPRTPTRCASFATSASPCGKMRAARRALRVDPARRVLRDGERGIPYGGECQTRGLRRREHLLDDGAAAPAASSSAARRAAQPVRGGRALHAVRGGWPDALACAVAFPKRAASTVDRRPRTTHHERGKRCQCQPGAAGAVACGAAERASRQSIEAAAPPTTRWRRRVWSTRDGPRRRRGCAQRCAHRSDRGARPGARCGGCAPACPGARARLRSAASDRLPFRRAVRSYGRRRGVRGGGRARAVSALRSAGRGRSLQPGQPVPRDALRRRALRALL